MQALLPWLVLMVAVPHELVCISAQSLSAAAAENVSSVHGSDGDHLLNMYAGQQLPSLVDRSKIQQDTQHQEEVQEVVGLEHTGLQHVLVQRPLVDTREESVQQERHHKRVVRQDEADHQDGQQDGHTTLAEQSPPESNGAHQQDPPQSDGAQQSTPQSSVTPPQAEAQSEGAPAGSPAWCVVSGCSCEAVSWTVSVNCTNAGLGEVPAGIHPNTTRLILSRNNLLQVGNDSLPHLNRVMSLYLGNNAIGDVHEDAFSGLRNLRVVDLSNNRLSALPVSAFRSSGKLQKLDLSGNPLQLTGGHLVDSASLYWLNLSRCGISSVPEDSFRGILQLIMLDLSDNQLAVPSDLALESLTGLRRLPLVGNPVRCCEVRPLRDRLERRGVSVTWRWLAVLAGPEPTCAAPPSLRGRPWSSAAASEVCPMTLGVAAASGLALLALASAALLVAAALLLLRSRRRARRRRRTRSALRRQQSQEAGDDGLYEPPPSAPAKLPGWSGPLSWSGPRYVASFKASQSQPPPPPPATYDDAVGAGRPRQASGRCRDAPTSPTYDDALGDGRTSPQYDYITGLDSPPHHASVPSVLEGCDFYEDA